MTETVENTNTEETKTEVENVETFDPREWARRYASAYKYNTMVTNTHLPEINIQKVIPMKETFECNSQYFNELNGVPGVKATKDIEGGGLIEECHYWVLESRLNDFIKGTRDKIAIRLFWTLPCTEEDTYKCEELGPHLIMPRGNAISYNMVDDPNAYWEMDKTTRTIRFYALRPISEGEVITIAKPTPESLGPSAITAEQFKSISGMNMAIPGDPAKKGCSSCQQKRQFRERTVEGT